MLLKLIGGLVVIVSSSFLGFALSRDCARRPQQLRELQALLQMFENQIVFLSDVLTDAFERVFRSSKSEVGVFFRAAAEKLSSGGEINAREAWEAAVRENLRKTSLLAEDQEVILSFGTLLGSSDLEGQVKNIRLTVNQLKLQEQKAEERRVKYEGMYRSLGILGGLAVVILLI